MITVLREPEGLTEQEFLREFAWVVLCAGMAEFVVRRKFPAISGAFLEWESARRITDRSEECIASALCHFRHRGKIEAIAGAARMLCAVGSFVAFREAVSRDPMGELQVFPYIGPVTALHLAKNIGLRVAKPDRHLTRLARLSGFRDVGEFCRAIGRYLGEDVRMVDSVLWRFSTIHPDYSCRFVRLMRQAGQHADSASG